jgi:hypothetical protein
LGERAASFSDALMVALDGFDPAGKLRLDTVWEPFLIVILW